MVSVAQPLLSAPKDKYLGPVHFEDKSTDHTGRQMVIEEKHGKAAKLTEGYGVLPKSCIFLYILAVTVTANLNRLLSLHVGLRLSLPFIRLHFLLWEKNTPQLKSCPSPSAE